MSEGLGRESKREQYYYYNTLTCLVKALEGKYTTLDLRNESSVTGKIVYVDGFMNVDLSDAIFYDQRGVEYVFENFFVNNRNIRYVHVPKGMSAVKLMEEQMSSMRYICAPKKRTFKEARALKRQKETLSAAYDQPSTSSKT